MWPWISELHISHAVFLTANLHCETYLPSELKMTHILYRLSTYISKKKKTSEAEASNWTNLHEYQMFQYNNPKSSVCASYS